jgi:hypothetical protein
MARPTVVAWALCAVLGATGSLTVGGIAAAKVRQGPPGTPTVAAAPTPLPGEQTALPLAANHDAPATTITSAELTQLVADRGKALQSHDWKVFLASVDPGHADVLTQQGNLLDNLQKIHFAAEDYAVHGSSSAETTFAAVAHATVDVDFEHRIAGVDPAPVLERYRWTVERSGPGGALRITAVAGAPASSGWQAAYYYPAPWDAVPNLTVITREHVLLMADRTSASYASRTADAAEQAAEFDLGHWTGGAGTVPGFSVFFTSDQKLYRTLYGASGRGWDVGMTIPIPGAGPETAGPDPSSRIVMDTTEDKNGSDDVSITLRHEMTHAMVFPLETSAGGDDTVWVVEGYAEWMAYRVYADSLVLRAIADSGALPHSAPDHLPANDEVYASDGKTAEKNYTLAQLAFMYMASKYGAAKVDRFVLSVYKADGGATSVDDAMRDVLGTTTADFTRGWAAYVRSHV